MNYLERLKRLETRQSPTDKTDKSTFVSSVSSLPARIETKLLPDPGASQQPINAELVALVNLIADYNAFSAEDRQEALEIALSDTVSALECFRALAARLPKMQQPTHQP